MEICTVWVSSSNIKLRTIWQVSSFAWNFHYRKSCPISWIVLDKKRKIKIIPVIHIFLCILLHLLWPCDTICYQAPDLHWFRLWFEAYLSTRHHLNRYWPIVKWPLSNELQWMWLKMKANFIKKKNLEMWFLQWQPFYLGPSVLLYHGFCSIMEYIHLQQSINVFMLCEVSCYILWLIQYVLHWCM